MIYWTWAELSSIIVCLNLIKGIFSLRSVSPTNSAVTMINVPAWLLFLITVNEASQATWYIRLMLWLHCGDGWSYVGRHWLRGELEGDFIEVLIEWGNWWLGAEQNSQGFLHCLEDQGSKTVSLFVKRDLVIPLPLPTWICIPTPPPLQNRKRQREREHHIL